MFMIPRIFPIIIFSLLTNLSVNAQFKKGVRIVGTSIGSFFFNSGESEYSYPPPTTGYTSNSNTFGITLNPSIGWFVSDNTAIGALLNFSYTHQKAFNNSNGTTYKRDITNGFSPGIGGFVRNYFNSSGTFKPFGQFNLNLGIGSTSTKGFYFIGSDKSRS